MEYQVGDWVRILRKPSVWASEFSENCPTQLGLTAFPFEGQITQLAYNQDKREDYSPAEIGNYGFDLYNLVQSKNIELLYKIGNSDNMDYLIPIFKKLKIK